MDVKMTAALKKHLDASGPHVAAELMAAFDEWKSASDEHDSYFFGKDSSYFTPKVGGKNYLLRHVHLVPLSDWQALQRWERNYSRHGRKTSNRVLVYASSSRGDSFLLIYVLDEPSAHEIAKMNTEKDRQIMRGFAAIAEAFLDSGTVIA